MSLPINTKQLFVKTINNYPNKPTIIFLHDSLGCTELWRDFPEKLGSKTQCNVLIYDRQGYGKSYPFSYAERDLNYMELEADILYHLITDLEIDKPILFGHSDGGSIALIAAGKYPSAFAGIITEGAHIFVEDITIQGIEKAITLYQTTNLKAKLEKYHQEKTEAMFWAWAATWTKDEFKSWNIEHFLPLITCPAFIIQGEDDEYGSLNQVEQTVNQVNGYTAKYIIPKVKHSPHKEVPELILEKSAQFVTENILDQ